MKICIIGGIFDKPAEYRRKHGISPETILAGGLAERGFQVTTAGHRSFRYSSCWDIIHVHHFGRAALRAALQCSQAQFVFTTHDGLLLNGWHLGWKRKLTDRLVLSRAASLIALSGAEKTYLSRSFHIPPEKIAIIPNGVDFSVFCPGERRVMRDVPFILHVGQLQSFKGIDYLLSAFILVREALPDMKLFLAYQHEGSVDHYKRRVAELGIENSVIFGGAHSAPELAELYRSAAVVVSPSLAECLSTVVLEAMACRAAVVATDVGGIRDQINHDTGVIVPAGDAPALASALINLLQNPETAKSLGTAAMSRVCERFSVTQMIERHLNVYESVRMRNRP